MSDLLVTLGGPRHPRVRSSGREVPRCDKCQNHWPKPCPKCGTGVAHADWDASRPRHAGWEDVPLVWRCQDCDATGQV